MDIGQAVPICTLAHGGASGTSKNPATINAAKATRDPFFTVAVWRDIDLWVNP